MVCNRVLSIFREADGYEPLLMTEEIGAGMMSEWGGALPFDKVVAALPHWVFDFVICAILGKVFKTIQEVAARMRAAPDTDRHAVAIRANRAFYQDFLAPRVAAAAKLHSA